MNLPKNTKDTVEWLEHVVEHGTPKQSEAAAVLLGTMFKIRVVFSDAVPKDEVWITNLDNGINVRWRWRRSPQATEKDGGKSQ